MISTRDLTPTELSEYKERLRLNLKRFHEFCEIHGLTYFLSDGTLLGAIRHKGMIPWDDDVDVCMPRNDYLRLLALSKEFPPLLIVNSFPSTDNYIFPYIKLVDSERVYYEMVGEKPYATGAWVDVFPLDGTYQNKTLRKLHYFTVKLARSVFNLKVRGKNAIQSLKPSPSAKLKKIIFISASIFVRLIPASIIYRIMDKAASHKNFDVAKIVGNLYTSIGIRASHDRGLFESRALHPFDGVKFYIPIGYHQYLKNLYGDYLTPPPKGKREQHNIRIGVNELNC